MARKKKDDPYFGRLAVQLRKEKKRARKNKLREFSKIVRLMRDGRVQFDAKGRW